MAQYYVGAYFTIAADSSENPFVPFLGRSHPIYQPCSNSMGLDTIFCERIPTLSNVLSNDLDALSRRGWAFQESALSKRILHYSACGLVWECRSITMPQHEIRSPQMRTRPDGGPAPRLSRLLTLSYDKERRECILSAQTSEWSKTWIFLWMDLVRDYSLRSLTWDKDKLPALSGIASAVSQATGWTYLAGHWENALPICLCWTVCTSFPIPIPAGEGSPSWSWASINGPVQPYSSYFDVDTHGDIDRTIHARVLNSECAAAGLNPFGQTKGGYVSLQGHIIVARLRFSASYSKYYILPITGLNDPAHALIINIDTLLEECDCKTPIFHSTKTLRRKHASARYDSSGPENVFVELLRIMEFEHGLSVYLVLGRSPTVHGAHVRLGILGVNEWELEKFRAGELPEPIVVTMI